MGSCVGAKVHLKAWEERFTKKIILKLCRMRGRRIKDNPVCSEIEFGMEVKIDAFQALISVGTNELLHITTFFVGIKTPACH